MSQNLQELAFGMSVMRNASRSDVPRQVRKVAFDLDKLAGRAGGLLTGVGLQAPVLVGAGAGALWTAIDRMVGGGSVGEQEQLERIERFRNAASKIERELTTSKRTKSVPARVLL
jgi:hypothetical protein